MRGIFLSVVVICALVAAGIGGTLADFSDSEEEVGDSIQAGSLDLKVNDKDGKLVGETYVRVAPEQSMHIEKTIRNVGTVDGWLYVHITEVRTREWNDKDLNKDTFIDEKDQPEPEVVAEEGGKHGQKMVPGIGPAWDIDEHIGVEIFYGPTGNKTKVDLSFYDTNGDNVTKMAELECSQLLVGKAVQCGMEYEIEFRFVMQDVDEDDLITDGTLTDPGTGHGWFDETDEHEVKWDHWPTNAYMGDEVKFDMLFELLQFKPEDHPNPPECVTGG